MSVTFRAVIEEMTRPASTPMQEFAERARQARLALRDKLGLSKPPSQGEITEELTRLSLRASRAQETADRIQTLAEEVGELPLQQAKAKVQNLIESATVMPNGTVEVRLRL